MLFTISNITSYSITLKLHFTALAGMTQVRVYSGTDTNGVQLGSANVNYTSPVFSMSLSGVTSPSNGSASITIAISTVGTTGYEHDVDLFSLDSIGYNYTTYGLEYGLFTQCNSLSDKYEFGYNGQMKMNEIAGIGGHLEFKFREDDPRIGRFWSIDPLRKQYPWNSPYAFAENRVIDGKDLEGQEYFPGNAPANFLFDFFFGWVTDAKDGAHEAASGAAQYFRSKAYQSGAPSDGTYSPPGAKYDNASLAEQHAVKSDENEGRARAVKGGATVVVSTAEGVTNLALVGAEIGAAIKGAVEASKVTRITASSLKELKALIKELSKPGSEVTKEELKQLEKLVKKFGGKVRKDLHPVKGRIRKPHVQIEGLGKSIESRHIWVKKGVK